MKLYNQCSLLFLIIVLSEFDGKTKDSIIDSEYYLKFSRKSPKLYNMQYFG